MVNCDEQPVSLFLYLGPEALAVLYPKVCEAVDEDLAGGKTYDELRNLQNGIRSHLQHAGIEVDT